MSGIAHKESLRGHERIKRRRVDPVPLPDTSAPTTATETTAGAAGPELSEEKVNAPSTEEARATASSTVRPSDNNSSSSSGGDDDDDDLETIRREQARLARLREQRERRTAGESPSSTGVDHTDSKATAAGGAQTYDSDVLFRRSDWRGKPQTEAQKRADQWSAVTNNTQASAAYKQSMKRFFK